jgi:hypothetical protein
MDINIEAQRSPVADEVQALIAVVIPILQGVVHALKVEAVEDAGGLNKILLRQLSRIYRPGDGDCGICFEYAVHEAVAAGNPAVLERLETALQQHCRIRGVPQSILFGAEKTGTVQLIETARDVLTDNSRLLSGYRGHPVKLKGHIDQVAAAFRRSALRNSLPLSISGLWKADLFLGSSGPDHWVGTTVKINPRHLEGAKGLRLAIVPSQQGRNDRIERDDAKNLVVVPLPYDGDFVEVFYQSWQIVQQFIAADAKVPKEVFLPRPADRQVARFLEERRAFPVLDVIEALRPMAQPELLVTDQHKAAVHMRRGDETNTLLIAPKPTIRRARK